MPRSVTTRPRTSSTRRRRAKHLHPAPSIAEAVRMLLGTIRRVGRSRGMQLIEAIGTVIAAEPRQVRARRAP